MKLKSPLMAAAGWCCLNAANLFAATTDTAVDLKQAVPTSAFMAVYGKHNPERDYQYEYMAEAFQTFRDEEICARLVKIVTSHAPERNVEKAKQVIDDVKEALEPVDWEALRDAEEIVFAQRMDEVFNQQVFIARLSEEGAEGFEEGITQLFEYIAEKSNSEKVSIDEESAGDASLSTLRLPKESPFQPTVARLGDVILIGSHPDFVEACAEQLQDDDAESKFDDPRFKEALEHLPEPEDCVSFFDAKQLSKDLGGISDFIRKQKDGQEKVERAARLMDRIFDELSVLDYEVSVEYTEEGQNRTAAIGRQLEGTEDKLLAKVFQQGEPFEDWHSWVPKEATAYSLWTGADLHVLYEGVMEIIREEIPESHEDLEKFEQAQDKIDLHLDEDILQSFSGEMVSFTLPVESSSKTTPQQVLALKCENPDRVRELIDRGFEALQKVPGVKEQQLKLVDCKELDGFKEVSGMFLMMVGAKPVFGFHDGWMVIASSPQAAEKLIAVRSGEADSIDRAASLEKFDLESEGDTYAVRYTDVGAGIRGAADAIDKVAPMLQMGIGMAGAQAKPEEIKPVMEALQLLPSIAKVVRKFDYYEQQLSITTKGPLPDSYLREKVTLIRQAEGK